MSELVATFTTTGECVKIGETIQVSGITVNDFTFSFKTYTVVAKDGLTKDYSVFVSVSKIDDKDITSFEFFDQSKIIESDDTNIEIYLPFGTDITNLIATFITTGVNVKVNNIVQISGTTANDFTNPVTYTVTASDVSTKDYIVIVKISDIDEKEFINFDFAKLSVSGIIDGTNITITVPHDTDVTNLVSNFVTTGVSVKVNNVVQVSGVTANDFSNQVLYTVTAADGSEKSYTVTVTIAQIYTLTIINYDGKDGVMEKKLSPGESASNYELNSDLRYELSGWSLSESGAVVYTSLWPDFVMGDEDVTLYTIWIEKPIVRVI